MRACLVAVVVAACAQTPGQASPPRNVVAASPEPPAASHRRMYRTIHAIRVLDNQQWIDKDVVDELTIREQPDGALAVGLWLVQTNDHWCTFDGVFVPDRRTKPTTHWIHGSTDVDADCHAELTQRGTKLELQSEGCRSYCDARAHLVGEFDLASPAPGSSIRPAAI